MHACCTLGSEKAPINLGSVRLYACVRLQIRTGGEKPIRSPTRRQSRISKSKVTLSPENNKTTLRLTLFRVFRVFRGLFVYLTLPYSQQPTKTHIKPHVPTYFFLTLRNCTFSATIHSPPSTALQLSTAVYTYLQLKRSYSQFEFPSLHLIQTRLLRNYVAHRTLTFGPRLFTASGRVS